MRIRNLVRPVAAALLASVMVTAGAPAAHAVPPPPSIDRSGFGDNGVDASGFYVQVYFAGEAQAYATVRVYGSSTCTGAPIGEDQADNYGHWGVDVTARPGQTVTGYANATDGTGTSSCSTTSGTYSVPLPPDTKLTKKPPKVVTYNADTHIDGTYVTFKYKSTTGSTRFECTIDKRPFACDGKKKVKINLEVGSHKFIVTAQDMNFRALEDPTPAKFKFKVEDKK